MADAIADQATHDLLLAAMSGYARRMHAVIGDVHHVASPLGAWLVLALAATAARGEEANRLAEVLGMSTADASRIAQLLLDDPHPAVATAAAAWIGVAPERVSGPAADWLSTLPASVTRGPIPTQDEADAWAREHTFGLIDQFPLRMSPHLACVLASALATRISWRQPFTTVDAGEFRSVWRDRVSTVLRSPSHGHNCTIVRHHSVGDLAIHRAYADGLTVNSVIAASAIPAAEVLDAAYDAARDRVRRYSLFDLQLGDGPAWTITESAGEDRQEQLSAVLPAWSARSDHDLRHPHLGFADAAAALGRLFAADQWEAAQSAQARYHQHGFEAAAATALAVPLGYRPPSPGRQRDALLRFDHPYAVIATASVNHPSPWHGLPVFSAWVTEPDDVEER